MTETPAPAKRRWKPRLILAGKFVLFALVAGGIWRRVSSHLDELTAERTWSEVWQGIDPLWLVISGVFYIAALAPAGWFWRHVLGRLGQQVAWRDLLRSYYIGHLGKYVPGKALVLVLRAALLPGCDKAVAVVAIFYETFTLMATCGLVSAVILAGAWATQLPPGGTASGLWSLLALALAGITLFPVLPPVFSQIYGRLGGSRLIPGMAERVHRLRFADLAGGLAANVPGTLLLGLSLWGTLQALSRGEAPLANWPTYTAVMSLSMVAGFVSLIPGGFGVREFVLLELLAPLVGDKLAIEATIVSRLVSVLAEALFAGGLFAVGPSKSAVKKPG